MRDISIFLTQDNIGEDTNSFIFDDECITILSYTYHLPKTEYYSFIQHLLGINKTNTGINQVFD